MLLVLDIGHTNIVAGVFDGPNLSAEWRFSSQPERTADELAVFLKVAFDARHLLFSQVRGVAIASVVPALTRQAGRLAKDHFECEPMVVGPETATGLINLYDNPRQLGADRLVNGLAAWRKFKTSVIIVDCGTATTVDAVSQDGHFLGGAIAPGLAISLDALLHAAPRLPCVELQAPQHAIGRDTVAAMQSGLMFGYAGLVKELVSRCAAAIPGANAVTVVATGGLSALVAPLVPAIDHIEPHLTLEGLRLIWELTTDEGK